jgi:hypothetical protein
MSYLAWPDSPGFWWCRYQNGDVEIESCKLIKEQLCIWALKGHLDYHYDQYMTWLSEEEFCEYGPCIFVKVAEPEPEWPRREHPSLTAAASIT